MKYRNREEMSAKAYKMSYYQGTRGQQIAKPFGETDYIRELKKKIGFKIKEDTLLE